MWPPSLGIAPVTSRSESGHDERCANAETVTTDSPLTPAPTTITGPPLSAMARRVTKCARLQHCTHLAGSTAAGVCARSTRRRHVGQLSLAHGLRPGTTEPVSALSASDPYRSCQECDRRCSVRAFL
ncbi:hypothetical protein HPB50_024878 [Hyalomma asiaticum]|uniref:Uncharacterized protein n=1 Tax=Hyalomma asiaticum TaxID=266040 RepID=A0ACB7S9H1_HYAAI|nr:hypothetical protein HPB50_024878 [Hyalomma asiaticum]